MELNTVSRQYNHFRLWMLCNQGWTDTDMTLYTGSCRTRTVRPGKWLHWNTVLKSSFKNSNRCRIKTQLQLQNKRGGSWAEVFNEIILETLHWNEKSEYVKSRVYSVRVYIKYNLPMTTWIVDIPWCEYCQNKFPTDILKSKGNSPRSQT